LLQLINQARENPLTVATSLGMDADQILKDLPELEDILINGLPPLIFNENLYAAASVHTMDMLENNYYSHISLDGRTYDDRIVEKGYVPTATGESLGMLAFFNFIQPSAAVALIFENMFRDELDPARTERRNILAGDLEEAGIGFGSGTFKIDGSIYNVYLTTCDFGAGAVTTLDLQLFGLINQARHNPLALAASLGMDPDQILEDLPELTDILTYGLPPLAFNKQLFGAASAHAEDMLENGYSSHDSIDGRTYEERIVENGYEPAISGEVMERASFRSDISVENGAWFLLERLFTNELMPGAAARCILEPAFKDVGTGFVHGESSALSGICGDDASLLVLDFGASSIPADPCLVGLVYLDENQDGLYSQGEGVADCPVSIEGPEGFEIEVYTGKAGEFSAVLPPGEYRITIRLDSGEEVRDVEIADENRLVMIGMQPEPNEQDCGIGGEKT
jgi:uncharacterized protein YkwD